MHRITLARTSAHTAPSSADRRKFFPSGDMPLRRTWLAVAAKHSVAVLLAAATSGCFTRTVYVERDRPATSPPPAAAPAPVAQAPVAPEPERDAGIVAVDQFYGPLHPYGSWVAHPYYGSVFVPSAAVVGTGFRPYTNGHWEYTEWGWTWVDNHPFGWATGHYGRWFYDNQFGWAWVPGTTWSPAWVTWRSGGGYMGWAPMPPGAYYGGAYSVYQSSWVYVYNRDFGSPYVTSVLIVGPGYNTCYTNTYPIYDTTVVYGRTYYRGPPREDIERSGGRVTHRPIRDVERERPVTRPPEGSGLARRDRSGAGDRGQPVDRDGRNDGSGGRGQPAPSGNGRGNDRGQPGPSGNDRGQPAPSGNDRGQPGPSGSDRGQPAPSGNDRGQPGPSGNDRGQPGASGNDRGQPGPSGNDRGLGQPADRSSPSAGVVGDGGQRPGVDRIGDPSVQRPTDGGASRGAIGVDDAPQRTNPGRVDAPSMPRQGDIAAPERQAPSDRLPPGSGGGQSGQPARPLKPHDDVVYPDTSEKLDGDVMHERITAPATRLPERSPVSPKQDVRPGLRPIQPERQQPEVPSMRPGREPSRSEPRGPDMAGPERSAPSKAPAASAPNKAPSKAPAKRSKSAPSKPAPSKSSKSEPKSRGH